MDYSARQNANLGRQAEDGTHPARADAQTTANSVTRIGSRRNRDAGSALHRTGVFCFSTAAPKYYRQHGKYDHEDKKAELDSAERREE